MDLTGVTPSREKESPGIAFEIAALPTIDACADGHYEVLLRNVRGDLLIRTVDERVAFHFIRLQQLAGSESIFCTSADRLRGGGVTLELVSLRGGNDDWRGAVERRDGERVKRDNARKSAGSTVEEVLRQYDEEVSEFNRLKDEVRARRRSTGQS